MTGRRLLVLIFLFTLPLVTPRLRASDEIEYFVYLRSVVFDGDLSFGNDYQHFYDQDPRSLGLFKKTFLDMREPGTGRHINFGPIGSAVLWAPFYLLVHLGVRVVGGVADGYSPPYIAAVCYASALYALLGALLMHDTLRRHGGFGEPAASWSPAALWLATPVLYYATLAPGFSHAPSLFAVSLLVWLWLRAREEEGGRALWGWILTGATGGLCALVREQDGLFLVAPALDLAFTTLARRAWREGLLRGAALAAPAFLVFLPQLAVYKVLTGAYAPSKMVSGKMDYLEPALPRSPLRSRPRTLRLEPPAPRGRGGAGRGHSTGASAHSRPAGRRLPAPGVGLRRALHLAAGRGLRRAPVRGHHPRLRLGAGRRFSPCSCSTGSGRPWRRCWPSSPGGTCR